MHFGGKKPLFPPKLPLVSCQSARHSPPARSVCPTRSPASAPPVSGLPLVKSPSSPRQLFPYPPSVRTVIIIAAAASAALLPALRQNSSARQPTAGATQPIPISLTQPLLPAKPVASSLPELAAAWRDGDCATTVPSAAAASCSRDPDFARAFSEQLLSADREDRLGHHFGLVVALAQNGFLDAALAMAQHSPAEARADALATVFRLAAEQNPENAREFAMLLRDSQPGPVFADVLRSWAQTQPSQVADFALTLPQSESRALALTAALEPWLARDPVGAGHWIARLENTSERDTALCEWLLKTDSLHRPTESALRHATTITDNSLRLQATAHLLREWAARAPTAARNFAETVPGFAPDQRPTLLAALTPLPTDCPSPP